MNNYLFLTNTIFKCESSVSVENAVKYDQDCCHDVERSSSYDRAELAFIDHIKKATKYDDSCIGFKDNFHKKFSIMESF